MSSNSWRKPVQPSSEPDAKVDQTMAAATCGGKRTALRGAVIV